MCFSGTTYKHFQQAHLMELTLTIGFFLGNGYEKILYLRWENINKLPVSFSAPGDHTHPGEHQVCYMLRQSFFEGASFSNTGIT